MSRRVVRIVERALSLGVSGWRQRRFDDGFRAGPHVGVCRGVYDTCQQAVNAAPKSGPLGYDHEGPAAMNRDRIDRVFPSGYPMMFAVEAAGYETLDSRANPDKACIVMFDTAHTVRGYVGAAFRWRR